MSPTEEDFKGHYRKEAKTSIVRTASGNIAPAKRFTGLVKLLASLAPIDTMKQKHPKLFVKAGDEKAAKSAPGKRVLEEKKNVEVVCWLHHVKSESDDDFHLIVGSSANAAKAAFLTGEVSGLPSKGKDRTILRTARQQLNDLLQRPVPTSKYTNLTPPRKVRIKGSLFFDGDHLPGKIGPGKDKPKTVWEIHPVVSIRAA
jgi:hypothetical protein